MAARVLLPAGVALVAIGIVLAFLRSFSYVVALSLGAYFLSCGLIARSARDRGLAAVLIIIVSASYVYVLATVPSPPAHVALALLTVAFALLIAMIVGQR